MAVFKGSIQKLSVYMAFAAMCAFPVGASQVPDIVFTDSPGAVLQAEVLGAASVISSGNKLIQPLLLLWGTSSFSCPTLAALVSWESIA